MLFVLKTPLASVGRSCCGLSICPVLTFKKPQQRCPELLTSLANVINHVLGTWVLLDKSHNICHAFCNFLLISHTLFSLSSPLAGEIYVWTRSDARELVTCHSSTGQYALWEIGVAVIRGWQAFPVPTRNGHWSVLPESLLDSEDAAPEKPLSCEHMNSWHIQYIFGKKTFYLENRLHVSCSDLRASKNTTLAKALPFVHLNSLLCHLCREAPFSLCVVIISRQHHKIVPAALTVAFKHLRWQHQAVYSNWIVREPGDQ